MPGAGDIEHWRPPLFKNVRLPPAPFGQPAYPRADAEARGAIEVKAALYLIARDTEVSWWQVALRYDVNAVAQLTERPEDHIRYEPCHYSRPVVSLRFLDLEEPPEFPEP